jgi:hypothetical protein
MNGETPFSNKKTVLREHELQRLICNMEQATHSLILGPPGIGKSFLLREAATRLNMSHSAKAWAVYVPDCSSRRDLLVGALAALPAVTNGAKCIPLHSTSRVEGWLRVQDLRDRLWSEAQGNASCLLLDHLPKLRHRMQRLLELLEERFTLACAVTGNRGEHDLYFWKFDKIELVALPQTVALNWVEDEIGFLGYGGQLCTALAKEIVHRAGGNPGLISGTIDVIRCQPQKLDDPIRVARMFLDGLLKRLRDPAGPRMSRS